MRNDERIAWLMLAHERDCIARAYKRWRHTGIASFQIYPFVPEETERMLEERKEYEHNRNDYSPKDRTRNRNI